MKLFISIYLMLCGLTFMALGLQAGRAHVVFASGLVALAGALFLQTTSPSRR